VLVGDESNTLVARYQTFDVSHRATPVRGLDRTSRKSKDLREVIDILGRL
jgi:hypothetical protein